MRKRTIASWHLAAWSTLPTISRTSAYAKPGTGAGAKLGCKPCWPPPSPISSAWPLLACSNKLTSPSRRTGKGACAPTSHDGPCDACLALVSGSRRRVHDDRDDARGAPTARRQALKQALAARSPRGPWGRGDHGVEREDWLWRQLTRFWATGRRLSRPMCGDQREATQGERAKSTRTDGIPFRTVGRTRVL